VILMHKIGDRRSARYRDVAVAGACGVIVAAMIGVAYAAVPLYNWFCRTTGFGGTPRISAIGPANVLERRIKVRFDANVGGGLPWRFEPETTTLEVRVGEVVTVRYSVQNESARGTVGMASFNVSPSTAGRYFNKIECFCFSEQRLGPGEKREMPVMFFVDPALADDPEERSIDAITLSYTMYAVRQSAPPQANDRESVVPPGRS
jgi:cytochrome c oxidase assembly protein subunit 11